MRTARALQKGTTSFVDAVRAYRRPPGLPTCNNYDRVEELATNLSQDLRSVTRAYMHGKYGIFANVVQA